MFFIMSTRPATLKSSPTTGSIQSEYIAPTMPEVEEEAERRDDRERPVDLRGEAALHRERELRARLHRRRRDELEEERRLADDDLAARLLGELHLVGAADLLRRAAERLDVGDARRERDAARHAVEEVQVVVVADELEELEHRRHGLRRDHEHRLLVRADGHRGALLDDALFDDATALDEADAEDLRPGGDGHRAHDRGHLSRASLPWPACCPGCCPGPGPAFMIAPRYPCEWPPRRAEPGGTSTS